MDKKEHILSVLKKLEPHRNILTGVIAMIELWSCSNEDIDTIINLIENHIKEIKDQWIRAKLIKAQNILTTIKNQENIEKIQECKDIDTLLEQIGNL
jgi:transcriptional regulator NrdR family protein